MANPYDVTRTNLFEVTDVNKFKALMGRANAGESELYLFLDCAPLVGFGLYDSLRGFMQPEDETDESWEEGVEPFLEELSKLIVPGDACILTCAYHEKLCAVGGYAYVVTPGRVECLSLQDMAVRQARKMLGNEAWNDMVDA